MSCLGIKRAVKGARAGSPSRVEYICNFFFLVGWVVIVVQLSTLKYNVFITQPNDPGSNATMGKAGEPPELGLQPGVLMRSVLLLQSSSLKV